MMIVLPFPDPSLFPNRASGKHWTSTRAMKDKARDDAYILTKAAVQQSGFDNGRETIPLTLTFCPPDKRRRDMDGMLSAAKHQLDGVAMALGVDDSRFDPITITRGKPGKPGHLQIDVAKYPTTGVKT